MSLTSGYFDELFFDQAVSLDRLVVFDGDVKRFIRADDDTQRFRPRERRVKQISLKHDVMLGQKRHHDRLVFATLRFMD